ncbi:MAG TPA: threonylcarbamoyl-AMP synthase [Candidatus Enterenecus merdae]|nr:threonylcarbamoyl-AMP synthase [Candidatus Enterenecus merdae]
MKRHVIFDLDGTLLNTIEDLAAAGNHVCRANGWPTFPPAAYRRMVGGGIPNLISRMAPEGTGWEAVQAATEQFIAYYQDHLDERTVPYPGITRALAALKAAGVGLAVLSNKAHPLTVQLVESHFPGVFSWVQGALPGLPVKPDPTLLRQVLDRLGASPEDAMMVGDSGADLRVAQAAGTASCGVLWGFRDREELEGAELLLDHPLQLVEAATGTRLLEAGDVQAAAELLSGGVLVALPTETVYGLAADATQAGAVQAIYTAKGRPEGKALNVLVDGMMMVEQICEGIPPDAYTLARAFWPGPLTMILRGRGVLPPQVTAGGDTQGVRCPDHPDTLAVIRTLGRPLACPSANRSGQPSPKSADQVLAQLAGRIGAVLDGGECAVGVESTILDLTVTPYRILRQGGLSRKAIQEALGAEVEGAGP